LQSFRRTSALVFSLGESLNECDKRGFAAPEAGLVTGIFDQQIGTFIKLASRGIFVLRRVNLMMRIRARPISAGGIFHNPSSPNIHGRRRWRASDDLMVFANGSFQFQDCLEPIVIAHVNNTPFRMFIL
jgi:hypothetical protein